MYGTFVSELRASRGLTQRQLAQIAGIPQPNVAAIERGHRTPSADTLNRLVVSLGYQLAAVAGDRRVRCALPEGGWFPDEGLPPADPSDPPDEQPAVGPDTSPEVRLKIMNAVLDAAGATRTAAASRS